jgi:hypothetical protein
MKLKARTAPMPARPTPPAAVAKKPPVAAAKKSNPFGAASAVDTASKLQEMDLKKKEEPVKKVDMWKKEPVVKADVPKEPAPVKQEEFKVEQKAPVKEEGFTTVVAPNAPSKEEPPAPKATEDKPEEKKSEEKKKKQREPEKVNSRAAAFETSAPVSTLLLGRAKYFFVVHFSQ